MMPDYPYPTSVQLIPDSVVVAAASVPSNVRKAVALALFRCVICPVCHVQLSFALTTCFRMPAGQYLAQRI